MKIAALTPILKEGKIVFQIVTPAHEVTIEQLREEIPDFSKKFRAMSFQRFAIHHVLQKEVASQQTLFLHGK